MKSSGYLVSTALIGATLAYGAARAQAVPAGEGERANHEPSGRGGIEEVVVTATKRPSRESKTAISMTTYTAAAIAQKGIVDIASLANVDPSINYQTGGGEGFLTIRGIASQNVTETGDPAVPVAVDGFFVNRPYIFTNALYDLDRIEVLRGPQGTLYGRNATGGLLNITTADPTKAYGGYGELTFGDYDTLNATGALNLPINDLIQLRASFTSLSHDGYRNLGPAGKGDTQDSKSGRVKVAISPVEHLKIVLEGQFTHENDTGPTDENIPFPFTPTPEIDIPHDISPIGNGSYFPLNFAPNTKIDDNAYKWRFTYDALPAGITATYLGGYDDLSWTHTAPLVTQGVAFIQHETPVTQNHELRFSSAQDQRLTWQVGGFYFNEDNGIHTKQVTDYPVDLINFLTFDYAVKDQSKAVFGQTNYKITPQISISAGLRYTWDDKSEVGTFALPLFGVSVPENLSGSWSAPTAHAGIDWNPTSRNLIYAKFDRGYKSGGFSGSSNYSPEYVSAYEVGSKNRFLDNHLSVTVDGFYEDYDDQQVSQQVAVNAGSTGTIIDNAGKSRIYGGDLQTQYLWEGLGKLDFNATLLHARYVTFETANGAGSANVNLAGNKLPNSPTLALTAGFEHTWDIPAIYGTVTGRIETKYESTQYLGFFNYPDSRQSGFTNSDLTMTYENIRRGWIAEAYVRNLENNTVLADYLESYLGGIYNYGFAPPRTYGFRLRQTF